MNHEYLTALLNLYTFALGTPEADALEPALKRALGIQ